MYGESTSPSKTDSAEDTNSPTDTTPTSSREKALCLVPCDTHAEPSTTSGSWSSESSASERCLVAARKRTRLYREIKENKELPPIGVYWDIENCQVPRGRNAAAVVHRIRECFFVGHRQAEFIVVCDVHKENTRVMSELHDAQVNIMHVSSICKNAADEKLRQSLRHFGVTYRPPATVVLISGDINFAADVADLRYRKNIRIILLHNYNVSAALKEHAHESFLFSDISLNIMAKSNEEDDDELPPNECVDVYISNLPINYRKAAVKNRLKFLSDNCGGRVVFVHVESGTAIIRFASFDTANSTFKLKDEVKLQVFEFNDLHGESKCCLLHACLTFCTKSVNARTGELRQIKVRAQRRLNGEDVFGRKIVINSVEHASVLAKSHAARKITKFPEVPPQPSTSWQNQASSRDWRSPVTRASDQPKPSTSATSFNCDRPIPTLNTPVELIITNLDASIRDLRTVLSNQLKQYALVYTITLNYQDSKPTALVKVSNQQEAEFIISKMHHQKLGYRRISISHVRPKSTDHNELKERVVYLLQEQPSKSVPLYLLLNTLNTKYLMRVSLCEINKLRDVCQIVEENGERLVTLTPQLASSGVNLQKPQQQHYCAVHCPNGITDMTLWHPDLYQLPCVNMTLKEFGPKLNKLLSSHMGTLPYMSFTICYQHEFGEPLPIDNTNGVPLEHLVTCIKNVILRNDNPKFKTKYIMWEALVKTEEQQQQQEHQFNKNASLLATSIGLLRREFVDLLRNSPRCQIPLGKFVPAYHHHFGRQLRVADYGFTKLDDLLHSPNLSNVIQILGDGSNRILTLTHCVQMRRFTSDLLRMVKSQVPKQIAFSEFNDVYIRVFNKLFSPYDYGVCAVDDLLDEIPENILMLNKTETEIIIGIPQRVRTADEILRTKRFAEDVVKLLSHSPNNSMLFDKFVPHYHHHFGYQCKVSDYGFTKLIELFEAIPETVKVDELPNSQRKISLSREQALNLLGNRILELIKHSYASYLPLEQLAQIYKHKYKEELTPQVYNCTDLKEVVGHLSDFVTISYSNTGQLLIPVQKDFLASLALRVWSLLISPPYHCDANKLILSYYLRFHSTLSSVQLEQLNNIVMTRADGEYTVCLVPEMIKAAKLYHLLIAAGGQVTLAGLESWYLTEFGEKLQAEDHSYEKFLNEYSFMLVLSRTRKKTCLSLNPKLSELKLPLSRKEQGKTDTAVGSWRLASPMAVVPFRQGPSISRCSPPKPDTPPPLNAGDVSAWQQQLTPNNDMEFSISLPQPDSPMYMPYNNTLISPAKNLLPAHPLGTLISSYPSPPEASELPMPDRLLKRDDSGDSGVNNSHFASENEMELSQETNLGAKPKYPRVKREFTLNF